MHRTIFRTRALLGAAVLALLAGVAGVPARAQVAGAPGSALIVPINGTVRLQMGSKKPISRVENPKDQVLSIRSVVGDPTTVLVTGQTPDVTTIKLTDVDGREETYQVIVQLDIEYLRTQLRRAVPTANVTPIPSSNNAVILAGTVDKVEDVPVVLQVAQSVGVQVINALRVGGVQQVQLDVVVASVTRSHTRNFGFDFLTNSKNFFFGSTTAGAVAEPATVGAGGSGSSNFGPALAGNTLSGVPSAGTNILFGVIHNSWGFLGFLQALRQEGVTKFLAEPRMVTVSGRPASFLVGGEQAVPVPAGLGQVGVQFEEFGTRLNFLPIVLGNGRIHLEVEPEISTLNSANGTAISGVVVPGRNTNRVNTTVELETGQTFVIGGLVQHTTQTNTRKTPVLGDLPFVGVFFSAKADTEIEEELVILVTPHLVDAQSCDQVAKILPGQETRTPDDFELFLEGIIEAPRGPRQVFKDGKYVPAYKNSPSAEQFPCAGNGTGPNGGGCAAGGCGAGPAPAPAAPAAMPAAAVGAAPAAVMPSAEPLAPPARPAETADAAKAPAAPDAPALPAPALPPAGDK